MTRGQPIWLYLSRRSLESELQHLGQQVALDEQ